MTPVLRLKLYLCVFTRGGGVNNERAEGGRGRGRGFIRTEGVGRGRGKGSLGAR